MNDKSRGGWLSIAAVVILVGAGSLLLFGQVRGESTDITVTALSNNDPYSYKLVTIDTPFGYEVPDGSYPGWCLDPNSYIWNEIAPLGAEIWNSFDPDMPSPGFGDYDWHRINYIINHKTGYTVDEVQYALWNFAGNTYGGSDTNVLALISDANANGGSFKPTTSDHFLVYFIDFGTWTEILMNKVPNQVEARGIEEGDPIQPLIIEVPYRGYLGDETAWAYSEDYTFIGEEIGKNWGWLFDYTIDDDSPLELEFWAGAGKNDLSKGEHVGDITVWNDATYLYVEYDLFDDIYMTESHIWADEDFPDKASPGLFPYGDTGFYVEDLTVMIPLSDFTDDDLIMAVHGVVWF
jgi:hypothetical protein